MIEFVQHSTQPTYLARLRFDLHDPYVCISGLDCHGIHHKVRV